MWDGYVILQPWPWGSGEASVLREWNFEPFVASVALLGHSQLGSEVHDPNLCSMRGRKMGDESQIRQFR